MRPAYQIYTIDLSQAAGREVINARANLLRFIDCKDGNGAFSPDGLVSVQIGLATADQIPLRINGKIAAETDGYVLTWTPAASTLLATFLVAENVKGAEVDIEAPPAKQLVTSASGTSIGAVTTSFSAGVTLVSPPTGTRQSITIRNNGSGNLYVGGSNVNALNGFLISPGDAFTFTGTTAAIYIFQATLQSVSIIQES